MQHRWWAAAAAALTLVTAACSSDDSSEATTSAAATAAPTVATTEPTVATTEPPAPSVAPTASGPATDASAPTADGLGVGRLEVTFTDTTRGTPASRDQPASAERVLDTVIWYPTGGEGPFPLVVFSHGLGGDPGNIAAVVDDWVRAGLVVAAPNFPLSRADHPGGPDAGDVQNQAGDVSFLIDTLTGTLDATSPVAGLIDGGRVGVAGHSNGAITTLGVTAHSCCLDERIDAALEMAGTPSPFGGGDYDFGRAPPFLIVHGTDDPLVNYANAVTVFNSLQGPKALLTIEGGDHGGYLVTAGRGHDAVVGTTVDFWLAYLADDSDALARLTRTTAPDPFVTVDIAPEEGSTATIATVPSTADREAIATPTSGLVSGQMVSVTWSGFLPGGTINIVQCSQGGTAGSQACDLTTGFLLRPNPTGAGTVELPIVAGAVGNGRCEAGITDCVILVNDSGLPEPEATIMIPLNFAA